MGNPVGIVKERWSRQGVGGRLWWSALATVVLAAGLVTTAAAVTDASAHPGRPSASAAGPSSTSSPAGSGASSMTGTAGSSGRGTPGQAGGDAGVSGMGTTASTDGICPNVQGATVMSDGMVMAPVPSGPPTSQQQAAADQLVAQVDQGILPYSNLSAAEAAGYRPATNPGGPMTHYLNPPVVESGDVLDPQHPSALMYANTVNGPVLLGAMFLGPAPCQPGPDIGGPLTQWHAHDDLCLSSGQVVGRTDTAGQCSTGVHKATTYFMLHVWTAPSIASKYQFQADLPPSVYQQIDQTGQP